MKFATKSTYGTIHKWIYRTKGKAYMCEKCETKESKTYEWSNKSGLYKQDLDDWQQLCKKCHHQKELSNGK